MRKLIVLHLSEQTVPRRTLLSLRDAGRIIRRRNVHKNVPIIRKSSMFIFGPDNPWVTYKLSTFAIMFFFKGKESYKTEFCSQACEWISTSRCFRQSQSVMKQLTQSPVTDNWSNLSWLDNVQGFRSVQPSLQHFGLWLLFQNDGHVFLINSLRRTFDFSWVEIDVLALLSFAGDDPSSRLR